MFENWKSKRDLRRQVEYWREEATAARTARETARQERDAARAAYGLLDEKSVALVEAQANENLQTIFNAIDFLNAVKVSDDQIFDAVDRYLYGDGVREEILFVSNE
jgi:hypothetical protein